jgi:ApaG protein
MKGDEASSPATAMTNGITVEARPSFVPEQSSPTQGRWFFSYRIRISNTGADVVQLLSRHWVITDAGGKVEEVKGPGVVGEKPVLKPGESFEYTSFCPLGTPFGTMEGSYRMVTRGGAAFDVRIPRFELAPPMSVH